MGREFPRVSGSLLFFLYILQVSEPLLVKRMTILSHVPLTSKHLATLTYFPLVSTTASHSLLNATPYKISTPFPLLRWNSAPPLKSLAAFMLTRLMITQ